MLRVKNAQARLAKPAEPAPTPGLYMERSQSRISLSASFEALAIYFPCMNSFDEDDAGKLSGEKKYVSCLFLSAVSILAPSLSTSITLEGMTVWQGHGTFGW